MHLITSEQWLQIDPRFTVLYNGSDDVVSIRPDSEEHESESVVVLPGHVIQVNSQQGYITRISRDGYLTEYLLIQSADEFGIFNAGPLLNALRKELTEIHIMTDN